MLERHVIRWPFFARNRHESIRLKHQAILIARKFYSHVSPDCEPVSRPGSWGRSALNNVHLLGSRNDSLSPPTEREIASLAKQRQIGINIQGRVAVVDSLKLRDACSCKLCVDPSTTQKLFSTADIPSHVRARLDQVHADGSFSVSWTADIPGFQDHISHYSSRFLSTRTDFSSVVSRAHRENPRIAWGRDTLPEQQITFNFDRYMNDKTTLLAVTKSLMQYGIALISDSPPEAQSVGSMASRIGPTMKTIYGETWDVRSVESPKNVADRDSDLTFHMVCVIWGEEDPLS